jgi:hypothetical protein
MDGSKDKGNMNAREGDLHEMHDPVTLVADSFESCAALELPSVDQW